MIGRHWLKLFSLVFAILLWAYVLSTLPKEYMRTISLEYLLPDNASLVSTSAKEVQVLLRGPRAFLQQLKNQKLPLPIDLRQFNGPFEYPIEVPITSIAFPLPPGVEMKIIHPLMVRLQLGNRLVKKLPLRSTLTGDFRKGLHLEQMQISPEMVEVIGPDKELSQMQFVALEAIERGSLGDHGELYRQAVIDSARFSLSPPGPYKVEYKLKASSANFTLKNIKIRFVSTRPIVSSTPQEVSLEVLVEGGEREISKDEVKVYADIPYEKAGSYSINLRAELPEDIHLVKMFPKRISVTVK